MSQEREEEIEAASGEEQAARKPSSPGTVIALFRIIAVLLVLLGVGLLGCEDMGILRVFAGSPLPLGSRMDWQWGNWGFDMWRVHRNLAAVRLAATAAAGGLLFLSAWGLANRLRWSVWVGVWTSAVCLAINSAVLGTRLWEVLGWLRNTSGAAFGKPEPQWADFAVFGPAIMVLAEVLLVVTIRLLTRLRVDVLR